MDKGRPFKVYDRQFHLPGVTNFNLKAQNCKIVMDYSSSTIFCLDQSPISYNLF